MRDEHIGQSSLLLKILKQVQDLRLNGNIQCRYRLIADDEFRIQRERSRDTDSLTASAVQLMRISSFQSLGKTDQFHHLSCLFSDLGFRKALIVDLDRLLDQLQDAHSGIQRCVGILEDHLDVGTVLFLEFLQRDIGNIRILEHDLTGGRLVQAHQGLAQCGLAAAGLSDDTDGLALLNVESDVVYCMQKSSRSLEVLLQILHFK